MKTLLLSVCIFIGLRTFGEPGPYIIKGTSDVKEGIAILDVYSRHPDTIKIRDGKFEFRGTMDKPAYRSFQIPPARVSRFILEPGEITLSYNAKDGYKIGGTPNNERLQRMDEEMKPYYDRVSELWKKYNAATGDARAKLFNECEQARKAQEAKGRELILADPNYSGFLVMLPTFRNETADVLKKYMKQFQAFKNDENFKSFADFYKGAIQTDFGMQAPDWTRPDPKNELLKLSSLRGKYVLIDFWYAGCVWCRKMTPHLVKVYSDLKNKGLEIVSVSIDTKADEDKWRKAMEEDAAPWLQAWDFEKKLPDEYGVRAYPTMFLLDKEGRVVEKIIGYREEPALREMFAKYIK